MIDFSLSEEEQMIRDTVRAFIQKEIIPLEPLVLRNEREHRPGLEPAHVKELQEKAKAAGFWGIGTPEEYGGADLGPVMRSIIAMPRAVASARRPSGLPRPSSLMRRRRLRCERSSSSRSSNPAACAPSA